MPTHDEIPDGYPVIDHMERRLGVDRHRADGPTPARAGAHVALAVAIGCVVGGGVLGVLLAWVQSQS